MATVHDQLLVRIHSAARASRTYGNPALVQSNPLEVIFRACSLEELTALATLVATAKAQGHAPFRDVTPGFAPYHPVRRLLLPFLKDQEDARPRDPFSKFDVEKHLQERLRDADQEAFDAIDVAVTSEVTRRGQP